ncbi:MAG TPA: TRAP transporter small permease [Stellaceae bacterium]|nr:TRAP transporter small permease [Stellaceae bacterium]
MHRNSAPLRVLNGIAGFVSRLLGVALIAAVILNFVNIVARYGFDHALTGADEFQIYLMVGMAFLGALVAHIRRRHLRMDVLTRHFSPPVARLVDFVEALLAIAVCGLMTWVSWTYTIKIFTIGSHSQNAHIPMWIPHSMLAVSFSLMTLVGVIRLFVRDDPIPAPGAVDGTAP